MRAAACCAPATCSVRPRACALAPPGIRAAAVWERLFCDHFRWEGHSKAKVDAGKQVDVARQRLVFHGVLVCVCVCGRGACSAGRVMCQWFRVVQCFLGGACVHECM